jgi:hypothetical protein
MFEKNYCSPFTWVKLSRSVLPKKGGAKSHGMICTVGAWTWCPRRSDNLNEEDA